MAYEKSLDVPFDEKQPDPAWQVRQMLDGFFATHICPGCVDLERLKKLLNYCGEGFQYKIADGR